MKYKIQKKFVLVFFIFLFLLDSRVASSHPINENSIEYLSVQTLLTANGKNIEFITKLPYSLREDLGRQLDTVELYYRDLFVIKMRKHADPCVFSVTLAEVFQNPPSSTIHGIFECQENIESPKDIEMKVIVFYDLIKQYDHFVTLNVGESSEEYIFTEEDVVSFAGFVSAGSNISKNTFFSVVFRFIVLGVEHIIFGYDHILFFLVIILVIKKLKNILWLVTSFTLAHSITLILAGLDIITLTARIVEPIIALSIVFMALRNVIILEKNTLLNFKERWMITFGFGLVHGLGFAGALSEIEIPKNHYLTALLTFNLGVEFGQIAILIVVLPLLWYLSKKLKNYFPILLQLFSGIIMALALVWTADRIFTLLPQ